MKAIVLCVALLIPCAIAQENMTAKATQRFVNGMSQEAVTEIFDDTASGFSFLKDLTTKERKAVFNLVSPDTQRELWLFHLDEYLQQAEIQNNVSQIETLVKVMRFIETEDPYSKDAKERLHDKDLAKQAGDLMLSLQNSFGPAAFNMVFVLGGAPTGYERPNQIYNPCDDPDDCEDCECHADGGNYCLGYLTCKVRITCNHTVRGCGFLWLQPCDGECALNGSW